MPQRTKLLAVAAAAFVVLGIAGYWAYGAYQKREEQRQIAALVEDTTARLRDALAVAPGASGAPALAKIEQHAAAADSNLEQVRRLRAPRNPALSEGAENYVLGAREIFRRQAAGIRLAEQAAASRDALLAHMGGVARRDATWIREATVRKKKAEDDYFNYNLALTALAELLWSMPDARKRLAPHVDSARLLEVGPAEDARRQVLQEAKRAADELDRMRRIAPR